LYHKFKAKITERNNIKFRSKKEARYYDELLLKQKAGIVLFFLRQPMFDLPGGTTYRADFMVFYSDGHVEVVDVKGHRTKEFIRNKKQVEALYPIKIEER
jgi:hypothetical protein